MVEASRRALEAELPEAEAAVAAAFQRDGAVIPFRFVGRPARLYRGGGKRALDLVLGAVLFAAFLPAMALVAAGVLITSGWPVLYASERVGRDGEPIRVWKFRTMVRDADHVLRTWLESRPELAAEYAESFKLIDDPRVTTFGRCLRKSSLDELPQFWNVLRGEMSLVGTRPPTPEEVAGYEHKHRKRICIKPGITGLWQVSGRNDIRDFDEVVRLDIEYIDRWSLWLDVKILTKTFRVLLARNGAY
jgi:lipopolysaccharide/colanic/teichoic acid biosynthesis glycosyltransferase